MRCHILSFRARRFRACVVIYLVIWFFFAITDVRLIFFSALSILFQDFFYLSFFNSRTAIAGAIIGLLLVFFRRQDFLLQP